MKMPLLRGQSLKVSVLNYFLGAFLGCVLGSILWSVWEAVSSADDLASGFIRFGFGIILMSTFSIPFGMIGLAPIAFLGEGLGRQTSLSAAVITVIGITVAIPLAIMLMPGLGGKDAPITGVVFGVSVTLTWAMLTFHPGGMSAQFSRRSLH